MGIWRLKATDNKPSVLPCIAFLPLDSPFLEVRRKSYKSPFFLHPKAMNEEKERKNSRLNSWEVIKSRKVPRNFFYFSLVSRVRFFPSFRSRFDLNKFPSFLGGPCFRGITFPVHKVQKFYFFLCQSVAFPGNQFSHPSSCQFSWFFPLRRSSFAAAMPSFAFLTNCSLYRSNSAWMKCAWLCAANNFFSIFSQVIHNFF